MDFFASLSQTDQLICAVDLIRWGSYRAGVGHKIRYLVLSRVVVN